MPGLQQTIMDRCTPVTESGCWLWDQHVGQNGYGQVYINRHPKLAHRISYMAFKGEIPKGMCVCHKCDVQSCVNPEHLFLGTQQDNVDDMHEKGRAAPHCKRKLSGDEINAIRAAYKTGGITQYELAELYDVGQGQVSKIINHKRRV